MMTKKISFENTTRNTEIQENSGIMINYHSHDLKQMIVQILIMKMEQMTKRTRQLG